MQAFQIRPSENYKPGKPVRSEKYKAFIRRLPCVVCLSTRNIEAAHTGPHGIGQKSSDHSCIPLCRGHHTKWPDSIHALGPVQFSETHGIDIPKLIEKFNSFFTSTLNRSY